MTNKQDYINFLKNWLPRNKAKGLLAQFSFEEEFGNGFLKKHSEKFFPGCWVVSPKSFDSNKYRYAIFVDEKLHQKSGEDVDSILGKHSEVFYKTARFLDSSSFGVIYAVPWSDGGSFDFSKINSDDFSPVNWDLHAYKKNGMTKIDPRSFFSNWRDGMRPRKPQASQNWTNDPTINSGMEKISGEKLEKAILKEIFYTGYLKSVVKVSTDDPYDVDSFIVSSETESVFPVELKEKSPVLANYSRGGDIREHYFGIDSGRISLLERMCSPSDSNAFYVVREVDDSNGRDLLGWKFMTLAGIVMASSWNAIGGGTGMFGSTTSTVKLPYDEFSDLTEKVFKEDYLRNISSRKQNLRQIADLYSEKRRLREQSSS